MLQITRRHRDSIMAIVIGAGPRWKGSREIAIFPHDIITKLRNLIVIKLRNPHLRQLPAGAPSSVMLVEFTDSERISRVGKWGGNASTPSGIPKCSRYAVTDGKVQAPVILRAGEHAPHCEPSAPTKDGATIRHTLISTAGGSAGATPVRAVAECLGGAGNSVMRPLPTSGSLKRSAHGRRLWSTAKPGILGITTP